MDGLLVYVVPLAFLMHGIGMVGGVYFVFTSHPWMGSVLGSGALFGAVRMLAAFLWVVSGVAFVAAAWGLYQDSEWWRTATWVAAPTSLVGIALWAGSIPPGTYVGAALAAAAIVALLLGW